MRNHIAREKQKLTSVTVLDKGKIMRVIDHRSIGLIINSSCF